MFLATSAKYPPAKPEGGKAGVGLPKGVGVAKSSVAKNGGATVSILGENGESAAHSTVLAGYRQDKVDERIWENIEAVWKRALEKAVVIDGLRLPWVALFALDTGTTSRASDAISSRLPFRSCGRTGLLEFSESTIDDPSMSPIYCSLLDTCINRPAPETNSSVDRGSLRFSSSAAVPRCRNAPPRIGAAVTILASNNRDLQPDKHGQRCGSINSDVFIQCACDF